MAFDKNKTIKKAQKYIQSGKIEAAIKEYVQIVQADPRDMASLQKLAGLYAKKQQVDDAVRCYETVGQSFTANGFYQKALAVYKLALQLDTRNGKLLHALAELYQTLGLRAEAVQHYRQAVALLREQDKFDEVLAVFERMLELSPDDQVIKAQLGEALFQAGRREEGIRVLKELSEMLKNEGKIEELGNFYERILALDPRDEEVRKDLARVYVRQGMAPKALRHLKYLFDNDSADAEVFDLVARVYVLMGKNDKAVAAFLQKVGHLQDAQEIDRTYQRILEIDPTNEEALRHLGEDDDEGFDFETTQSTPVEAAATSAPAVQNEVTGGEYAAAINEASVYLKYGILDRAVEQLQEVIQSDPNNIDAHLKLLDAYEESGQTDKQADVFVQLAELYEAIGDISQSEKMVGKARAINPSSARLLAFTGEEAPAEAEEIAVEPATAVEDADVLLGGEEDAIEVAFEDDVLAADDDGAAFLDDASDIEETDAFGVSSDDEDDSADAFDVEIEVEDEPFVVDDSDTMLEEEPVLDSEPEAVELEPAAEEIAVDVPEEEPEEAPWQEDLEQADFLVEQAHYEEAEELLANLAAQYPDATAVSQLLARVRAEREISEGAAEAESVAADTGSDDGAGVFDLGDDGFDLASELESELDFLEDEGMAPGEEDVPTMEEIFSEFKKGVKEQLDDSDASAHYDLGIAYLEMGLTADAVSEFELAANSPEKAVDALNMIGVAKVQLGDNAGAVEAYERALAVPDIHADASLNLNFEVANVLAEMQEYRRAVAHYKEVVAVDRNYRDVGEKIRDMKAKLAGN